MPKTRAGVVILTNGDNGGHIIEAVVPLALPNGDGYLAQYIGQMALENKMWIVGSYGLRRC